MIDFKTFLRIQTLLRYYTVTKDQSLEFWLKFLNPQRLPILSSKNIFEKIELLARGSFTIDSTLISEKFAQGFIKMLELKGCTMDSEKDGLEIDMKKLKMKLIRNEIDIEYLN